MGKAALHLVRAENLECPVFEALHEGGKEGKCWSLDSKTYPSY